MGVFWVTQHGNFGRRFESRPAHALHITDDEIALDHGSVALRLWPKDDGEGWHLKLYPVILKQRVWIYKFDNSACV